MRYLLIAILLLLSKRISYSQDTIKKGVDVSNMTIEELMNLEVYVAAKKFQKVNEAPAIATVVTQKQIRELGANTLADVLKHLVGVEVMIGQDGEYQLALRGLEKNGNILMLINGQTLNDFYSGNAIFDINPDIIEKIELLKNPGSALYGSNAMSGILNITLVHQNGITASVGLNEMVTATGSVHHANNHIELDALLSYSRNTTNNNIITEDKSLGAPWSLVNQSEPFETNRFNDDIIGSFELVSHGFSLNIFNLYRKRGGYAGPLGIATNESSTFQNRFLSQLKYDYLIAENVIITPKVYFNNYYTQNNIQEYPDGYVSTVSGDVFSEGKWLKENVSGGTYGAEMDILVKVNNHFELLTGSIFEDLRISSYSAERNYNMITDENLVEFGNHNNLNFSQLGATRYVFAYFLQGAYSKNKINITGGLRYDDYNDFGQSFNPRIGVSYNVNSSFRIKGMFSKAFRAPTFKELYDNTNIGNEYGVKGNEDLRPESIYSSDLGADLNLSWLYLKYNLFYTKNTNLIRIYDPYGGGSVGEYLNIGYVQYFGHEAEASIKIGKHINVFANSMHLINRFYWNENDVNKSSVLFLNSKEDFNRELRHLPTIRVNAGVQAELGKFKAMVSANYGNARENNNRFYLEESHYVRIPYYVQFNANVQYSPMRNIAITLMANNIGKKYVAPEESTGINSFGRLGMLQPRPIYSLKVFYKL